MVREAASYGLTYEQIAGLLTVLRGQGSRVSSDQVKAHYPDEYRLGRSQGVMSAARTLYQRATGCDELGPPDVNALKFYLERRGGWVEEPRRLEVGRPGEFAHLSDDQLMAEIEESTRQLQAIGLLPAPDPDRDQAVDIEAVSVPSEGETIR